MSDTVRDKIKALLDDGDDIFMYYLLSDDNTCKFLLNNKDILLNHPSNPMSPKDFFKRGFDPAISDKDIQSEFVELALDYGVDITEYRSYFSIKFAVRNQEILLNHPTNPMSLKVFLKMAFFNDPSDEYEKEILSSFVKLALENAIDLEDVRGGYSLDFLVDNQDMLLKHPSNPISPDKFLVMVMSSMPPINQLLPQDIPNLSTQYDLVKKSIELGGNVKQEVIGSMGKTNLLEMASSLELIELLKSHGAECGASSKAMSSVIAQENLQEFLDNPQGISYDLSNNLLVDKEYVNKIPYIVHHVWFTHPDSPREISDNDIDNVIKTKETFGGNVSKWSHIVWTNDKDLIPNSIKILEENGIEVRSIKDYQEDFRLFNQVMELVDKKLWGMASDTLRYNALEKFGGIYSDLNFECKRSIEEDLYKYDFVAQDFINYFFAAKPNHPIITNLVNMVEENLNNPTSYISYMDDKAIFDKTVFTSLVPFSIAILKYNNIGDNIDMIYSHDDHESNVDYYGNGLQEFYQGEYSSDEFKCDTFRDLIDIGFSLDVPQSMNYKIGVDGYKGSTLTWIEE